MPEDSQSFKQDSDRLDGWKEIAAYLRKDVRTAIRWSKHEAMPVYRHAEGKRGAIYAYRSEIDQWIHSNRSSSPKTTGSRSGRGPVLVAVGAAAALILGVGAVFLWLSSESEPPSAPIEQRPRILITDFDNRTGEARFDGTLETALRRELANSRHVSALAPERIWHTLMLMQRSPDATIDPELGREICLRVDRTCAPLTGRVEKFGLSYLLGLELLDPADGRTVASAEETAREDAEVLPAVHRLGDWLRNQLGEDLLQINLGDTQLERVATPSLRALEIYSRAIRLPLGGPEVEALLRQAVEEDPGFASAYVYLFWSLYHQGEGSEDEARAFLRRAMELAGSASDEERYFITGTYYDFIENDQEESCKSYKTLAELFPDHFYAAGNAAHVCGGRLGHRDEYVRYTVQVEELRSPEWTSGTAAALALIDGDFDRARPYVEKLRRISADGHDLLALANESGPSAVAFTEFFSAEESLDKGLLSDVASELERVERMLDSAHSSLQPWLAWKLHSFHLALGQFRKARALHGAYLSPARNGSWVAFLAGDEAALDQHLDEYRSRLQERLPDPEERLMWLLGWNMHWAAGGTASQIAPLDVLAPLYDAESAVERATTSGQPSPLFLSLPKFEAKLKLARGRQRLAEGKLDEGIELLQSGIEWFQDRGDSMLFPYYFLGAELLAVALAEQGDLPGAYQVLKVATRQEDLVFSSTAPLYQRLQARLALFSRELGRPAESQAIEAELEQALSLADPDHPILVQIREQQDVPRKID